MSGSAREVVIPPNTDWFLNLSPTAPFAALTGADGSAEGDVRFLGADGSISAPLTLPPGPVFFTRWSEDGSVLRGLHNPGGHKEGDEPDWYAVDPRAMTVRKIPPPPKNKNGENDYGPDDETQDKLPLRVVARKEANGSGKGVWIEARDNPDQAVRLTPNGYPVCVLPDLSGALYHSIEGLYFVPLLAVEKDQLPPAQRRNERKGIAPIPVNSPVFGS